MQANNWDRKICCRQSAKHSNLGLCQSGQTMVHSLHCYNQSRSESGIPARVAQHVCNIHTILRHSQGRCFHQGPCAKPSSACETPGCCNMWPLCIRFTVYSSSLQTVLVHDSVSFLNWFLGESVTFMISCRVALTWLMWFVFPKCILVSRNHVGSHTANVYMKQG